MLAKSLLSAAISAPLAQAALLWDGRFNDLTSAADLNLWSWADQVGPYQYYIHGNGTVDQYVALSPNYTNPADSVSRQGAKITLDGTAYWNGQDMRRTELIPRPDEIIDSNLTFWHFSIRKTALNEPVLERLHKYAFFEAGFSELNSGYTGDDEDLSNDGNTCNSTTLRWMREHQTAWWVEWEVDTWYNFAYEVDFTAKTVGLWHSTGAADLEQVVAPVFANTTFSSGYDFHVGHLELPRDGYKDTPEDVFYSGVYIESETLTKTITGPTN